MLLESSVMYWEETLGEKMNKYLEEPWDLQNTEATIMSAIIKQFPKKQVGLIENNPHNAWERSINKTLKTRFRSKQTITIGINYLGIQAFSDLKFLVLMSGLVFVLVGFSFFLILKSWSNELKVVKLKEEQLDLLAHEMLTPLSIITIAMERIQVKSKGQLDLDTYLRMAKTEIKRMEILSRNILFKGLQNKPEPINLISFLNQYQEQDWEGL